MNERLSVGKDVDQLAELDIQSRSQSDGALELELAQTKVCRANLTSRRLAKKDENIPVLGFENNLCSLWCIYFISSCVLLSFFQKCRKTGTRNGSQLKCFLLGSTGGNSMPIARFGASSPRVPT